MPVPVYIFIEKLYFFRNYNYASIMIYLWKNGWKQLQSILMKRKWNILWHEVLGFLVNEETSQLNFAQTCCLISNSSSFMLYFFLNHLKLCAIGILVKTHFFKDLNLALMHVYIRTHTCELSWSQFICCHKLFAISYWFFS